MGTQNRTLWKLAFVLFIGSSSGAAFAAEDGSVDLSHGTVVQTPLFYAGSLEAYDSTFRLSDGSPNHPDSYRFAIKKGACNEFPEAEAIYYYSSSGYSIFENTYCLNLQTGDLFRKVKGGNGIVEQEVIPAAATGRVQLAYARALSALADGALKFRKGHYQPMYGFNAPERPALQLAVDYMKLVQNLYIPTVGSWLDVQLPELIDPDTSFSLFPTALANDSRDLVIAQYDQFNLYSLTREVIGSGLNTKQIYVRTPAKIQDPASFHIRVSLIASTANSEDTALDLVDRLVKVQAPNRLNYFFCSYQLVVDRDLTCTLGTKTIDPMDVRLDLFDLNGQWLAGLQQSISSGFQSNTLALALPSGFEPGTYTVHAKLLNRGADWSSYIDQKTETVKIQAVP